MTISTTRLNAEKTYILLCQFDGYFSPPLSSHIDISTYSQKLSSFAHFVLCKEGDDPIGYIAFYENKHKNEIYITSLCVKPDYRGNGISHSMIDYLSHNVPHGCDHITLEVRKDNFIALSFYEKEGFEIIDERTRTYMMNKLIYA